MEEIDGMHVVIENSHCKSNGTFISIIVCIGCIRHMFADKLINY